MAESSKNRNSLSLLYMQPIQEAIRKTARKTEPRSSKMRNAALVFSQFCELLSCAVCIYNTGMEFLYFDNFAVFRICGFEIWQNFQAEFRYELEVFPQEGYHFFGKTVRGYGN